MPPLKVFVVAAEASGDRLGAGLIHELRKRKPDLSVAGVGGHLMRAEGVTSPFDIAELSVFGLVEGLKAYPRVVQRVKETVAHALKFDPDIIVLIDSWGFTLRVAKALRNAGARARLVKYIGPQVWASRPGRAKTLARTVDHLICIYDIETPYYAPYGLPCSVCGNPVANAPAKLGDGGAFRVARGLASDAPLLLVLFGSRPAEINRLGDVFVETVTRLQSQNPDLRVATFVAPTVRDLMAPLIARMPGLIVATDDAEKEDVFNAATAALACSGSVTTELALQGAPMVVAYRVGGLTWFIARNFLFHGRHVTLLNIAASKEIVQEFLQDDCTVEKLVPALNSLLINKALRTRQVQEQALGQRHIIARACAGIELPRAADLLRWVRNHFAPLRDPAAGARQREQNREHILREAHGPERDARIEVDVRIELLFNEERIAQSDTLKLERDLEDRVILDAKFG
jgi:lipid-A-disaccharide synthase